MIPALIVLGCAALMTFIKWRGPSDPHSDYYERKGRRE